MKTLGKALVGLVLLFVWHLPRLVLLGLVISYAAVFQNERKLTASPDEHLKRARKLLRRGRLSELLYAALEIRFALERMAQRDLAFADAASNRALKEPDPVKKIASLHRLAPEAAFAQTIWFVNKTTGQRIKWGLYKPLDKIRVAEIKGRLGDLLHPKEGLLLGIPNDPWYLNTKEFLAEALRYLSVIYKDNALFFSYDGVPQFEMTRQEDHE